MTASAPRPPYSGGRRHAEDVVLLRQRDDLVVEPVLDVAQLLVRADLLAEGLDVGEQLFPVGGGHAWVSFHYRVGDLW